MARKSGAVRANAEMLSKLTSGGRARRTFDDWLKATPKAKGFIELWLELRAKPFGDPDHSDWSATEVFNELRKAYECPFVNRSAFHNWLRARHG